MGIFRFEGLYIGIPTMFYYRGKIPNGFFALQLACSRDLHHWRPLRHGSDSTPSASSVCSRFR